MYWLVDNLLQAIATATANATSVDGLADGRLATANQLASQETTTRAEADNLRRALDGPPNLSIVTGTYEMIRDGKFCYQCLVHLLTAVCCWREQTHLDNFLGEEKVSNFKKWGWWI